MKYGLHASCMDRGISPNYSPEPAVIHLWSIEVLPKPDELVYHRHTENAGIDAGWFCDDIAEPI